MNQHMYSTAHVVLISDEQYIVPTSVAIQSLIDSRAYGKYEIIIVTSGISEETYQKYMKFQSPEITIRIIKDDASVRFEGYHTFKEGAICVASIAALLKFALPELLPDLDRVLYLDGDLIVKEDLHELYQTDLEGNYLAAVKDSGAIYYHGHKCIQEVKNYFNSGVMLLDLQKMRELHLSEKLMETKKNLTDASLMDQNVFNYVMDGHVKLLPIRYNLLPVNLWRAYSKWTLEDINHYYDTEYETKADILTDAAIIHYSSKDKPWKAQDGACASEWIHEYLRTPLEAHDLVERRAEAEDEVAISVIVPCYNVEKYVEATLNSILQQNFSKRMEVICIDDGSSDGTLAILQKYSEKHPNVRVYSDENHGQGYQRNFGVSVASGRYIYYMDSDDQLKAETFQKLYDVCEENQLDLIYFGGQSIYETKELEEEYPQYQDFYIRKEWYPQVFDGKNLYIRFINDGRFIVSPCMQMVRREFLVEKQISFQHLPAFEDELYTYTVLRSAKRVKVLKEEFYLRYVRADSSMTRKDRSAERVTSLMMIIRSLFLDCDNYVQPELRDATQRQLFRFKMRLDELLKNYAEGSELLSLEDKMILHEIESIYYIKSRKDHGHKAGKISVQMNEVQVEFGKIGYKNNLKFGFRTTNGDKKKNNVLINHDGSKNWVTMQELEELNQRIDTLEKQLKKYSAEKNMSLGKRIKKAIKIILNM